jgi:hypothetical protein
MRLSIVFLAVLACQSNADHVAVGEFCNITGQLAVVTGFVGNARVGGLPGCTIGNETDCYCAPQIDGVSDASEWLWQCGDDVHILLGPYEGKQCPDTLPSSGECDATIYPSGAPGDPGCGYSDCGGAATFSSMCGCIDLAVIGQGEGVSWYCFNSTCYCPHAEESTSGAAVASILPLGLLVGVLGFIFN